jgi:hypothetical protein
MGANVFGGAGRSLYNGKLSHNSRSCKETFSPFFIRADSRHSRANPFAFLLFPYCEITPSAMEKARKKIVDFGKKSKIIGRADEV